MSRFYPVEEAIEFAMLGNDDVLQRSKGRMLKWAKQVYRDMNMVSMKIAVRERFQINKRTNTVDMPCDFDRLSSVNVEDHHGVFHPVYRNDRLHDDIVDIPADKSCACEKGCAYKLCNLIKGYESVVSTKSDKNPNGSDVSFTCVDRICVERNGFVYKETQYPKRIYTAGVWTSTVLYTDKQKICECEVDVNGCICDTPANINAICTGCNIGPIGNDNPTPIGGTAQTPPSPNIDTWIYHCSSKLDAFAVQCGCHSWRGSFGNYYNISETGDRLIFPRNFGFSRVMIRYYRDVNTMQLQIPAIALTTFVTGLKWYDCRWNDKKQNLAMKYEADFTKQMWGLLLELNKYRIAEMNMIMTPPVHVPSYIDHRVDNMGPWENW